MRETRQLALEAPKTWGLSGTTETSPGTVWGGNPLKKGEMGASSRAKVTGPWVRKAGSQQVAVLGCGKGGWGQPKAGGCFGAGAGLCLCSAPHLPAAGRPGPAPAY